MKQLLFKIIVIAIILTLSLLFISLKNLVIKESYTTQSKSWNTLVSDTYYINLDRSTDRKLYMEHNLSKTGIPYTRFPGIEGKNRIKTYWRKNVKIRPGALGCKLSHLEILKKVKKDGWTIVFEDDVLFDSPSNLKDDILTCLNGLPDDAEIVLFGTSPRMLYLYLLFNRFKPYKKNIWKTDTNLSCAHAYAINWSGAQKWAEQIKKYMYEKPFDMHTKNIDTIYLYTKNIDNYNSILLHILKLKDLSYIEQNKERFGYLNSLVTFS